jgi:hypothetical protein
VVLRGEPYALITSCSDVIDFLKSSEIDPVIGLILIAIRVEPEYRSISTSLSRRNPKGEPNTPIVAESEMADLFKAVEVYLAIGLVHDSYWGRARVLICS